MPKGLFNKSLYGVVLMVLAMQLFTSSDIFVKRLANEDGFSPIQIAFGRFIVEFVLIILAIAFTYLFPVLSRGSKKDSPKELLVEFRKNFFTKWHTLRGLFWAGSVVGFFLAIDQNPIPTSLAITFIAPLVVSTLGALILKERFDFRAVIATLVGLVGVVVIIEPFTAGFNNFSILFALMSGVSFALFIIASRGIKSGSNTLASALPTSIWSAIYVLPLIFFYWEPITLNFLIFVAIVGLMTVLAQLFIIFATKLATAALVAPFHYTEMIGATVVSYLVFGDLPSTVVFLGTALVVVSGLYTILLLGRKKPAPPVSPVPKGG